MRNKKKIKVPAAAFGINADDSSMTRAGKVLGGIGDSLGDLGQLGSLFLGESNATTQGQVVAQSLLSTASGIATGAKIGNSIVPGVGGAVGAVGGAIAGAIGKRGRYARMTSFTDYDEGTLSTGLSALGGANSRRRRERNRVKQNAMSNRDAVRGTEYLSNEYAEDYGGMDTNTFAYGGAASSLAYVDDGELIQTPDGQVSQVPEQGKPTDSNLVSLPEGSRVLSDKLKVPGTKKTFAELGKEIMITRKSKNTDRFAQNAAKLNEMNNKSIHDQLFTVQEQLKEKKGIKPKTKNLVQAAVNGDEIMPNLTMTGLSPVSSYVTNLGEQVITPTKQADLNRLYKLGEDKRKAARRQERRDRRNQMFSSIGNSLSSGLSDLSTLAPIMSNLFSGKAENVNANYNPYASTAMSVARRRSFDPSQSIQDINRNRAIANYNLRNMNTNTGANMAYSLQSATNTDKAIAGLRTQENNINNQYLGEYANLANSFGQQWVGATNLAADQNAQNRATNRNIRRTGLSQLSQWAQNRELMSNQEARDMQMWPLYQRFLQAGFTEDDLSSLMNANRNILRRKGVNYAS